MRLTFLLCFALLGMAAAQTPAPHAVMFTPPDFKWMPAPAATGVPSAVQMAVLSGDLSKTGMFTIRLKIPDGGKIAAHWHPTDEHLTVLEGTFAAGMGDAFDDAALHEFPVGSYIVMPKRMRHFAMAKGDTVLQLHAMGPFVINYVNPADDPRKK